MKHKVHLDLYIAVDDHNPVYCNDDCQFLNSEWHYCKLHNESVEFVERDESYALYSHRRCSTCIAPKASSMSEAFHEAAGAFQQLAAAIELELSPDEIRKNLEQARTRFSRAQNKARRL